MQLHIHSQALPKPSARTNSTYKFWSTIFCLLSSWTRHQRRFSLGFSKKACPFSHGPHLQVSANRRIRLGLHSQESNPVLSHLGSSLHWRYAILITGTFIFSSRSTVAKINSPRDRGKKVLNRVSYALIATFLSAFPRGWLTVQLSKEVLCMLGLFVYSSQDLTLSGFNTFRQLRRGLNAEGGGADPKSHHDQQSGCTQGACAWTKPAELAVVGWDVHHPYPDPGLLSCACYLWHLQAWEESRRALCQELGTESSRWIL